MKLHKKLSRTIVRTDIILENTVTLTKTKSNCENARVENSYSYRLLSPLQRFLVYSKFYSSKIVQRSYVQWGNNCQVMN